MRNESIELILKKFIENETKQFTKAEFITIFFEVNGFDSNPLYLENKAGSFLRLLKLFKCIKLVGSGTTKIYELNLIQIKKVFPLFKDFDFSKKEKAVK